MSKQNGLVQNLYVAGVDISGDTGSIGNAGATLAHLDYTTINLSSMARVGGKRDASMDWSTFFNPTTGESHDTLNSLPGTNVSVLWAITPPDSDTFSIGDRAIGFNAKRVAYNGNRADDGAFSFQSSLLADARGIDMAYGRLLTAGKASQSSAGSLASLDAGASSDYGLQAYLQLFAFTGTSITVTLEESSDDGSGDAWEAVAGGAFNAASAIGAERIETARDLTVERYLRVTTTGTFTAATFAVGVFRNQHPVTY